MDGKHSMRLQNVNVYVWTGPQFARTLVLVQKNKTCVIAIAFKNSMT